MKITKIMLVILVVFLGLEPFVHVKPEPKVQVGQVDHVPEENHPTTTLVVNGGYNITSSFHRHFEVHQVRDWSLPCSGSV
jgi:hypothetical protein